MLKEMALQTQLDEVKAQMMAQMPEEVKTVIMEAGGKLAQSGLIDGARQKGDAAPKFTLPGVNGATVTLDGLLSKGPTVLTFYRGAWCPYCSLQFKALQAALPEIEAAGATLVGISPSTPDNSLSMAEKMELRFEVLSDAGNFVAKQY